MSEVPRPRLPITAIHTFSSNLHAREATQPEVEPSKELSAKEVEEALASTSENVAYRLARMKVIDSLTPSEQIQVLKNAENYLKALQGIFGTWRLPNIPMPQPQPTTQKTSLSQGSAITLLLAKYAIDKIGSTAISSLVNNPRLQKWVTDFLGKLMQGEKP